MKSENNSLLSQDFLPGLSPITSSIEELALASNDERGAIFTRREVVDFILDLVGYVPSNHLQKFSILEPSFGHGDFLLPIVERLLISLQRQGIMPTVSILHDAIRGVELHHESFHKTKSEITYLLTNAGLSSSEAGQVLDEWLIKGDFLLTQFDQGFTHVVGNPPYIRQEAIPDALISEYRRRFETIYDRADIYVPFIEYSLKLLDPQGTLGFICANRWMKNKYGSKLREFIRRKFHLKMYIDMVGTDAFHSNVIAYPAITIIANEKPGPTYVAKKPEIETFALRKLTKALVRGSADSLNIGDGPWALEYSESLSLVRRLETAFPSLEEAGCKVGIGVATGADKVFIAPYEKLDIEDERKLPLVMTKDIQNSSIEWRGFGVINPFGEDGKLVELEEYPKFHSFLKQYEFIIKKRHVSKKNPNGWFRTIDRIYPELVSKEKLLIPDIKGDAHIVYDKGEFYPHHNLYYITSSNWNLKALQAVLMSGIARLFIETYSTQMHGNCLRFQAQYLRRIRIPHWDDVPKDIQKLLIEASENDPVSRNRAVGELYSLSSAERASINLKCL